MENPKLRIWNRYRMMQNILNDAGEEALQRYMANFTAKEVNSIYLMAALVKYKGFESVQAEVVKSVEVVV